MLVIVAVVHSFLSILLCGHGSFESPLRNLLMVIISPFIEVLEAEIGPLEHLSFGTGSSGSSFRLSRGGRGAPLENSARQCPVYLVPEPAEVGYSGMECP
jgi:hypothetical protein